MARRNLFISVFLVIISACQPLAAQTRKETGWAREGLKGRVKKLEICSWMTDSIKVLDSAKCHPAYSVSYNQHGFSTEFAFYYSDSLESITKYKYNAQGKSLETRDFDKYDSLHSITVYEYDERGNKIRCSVTYADGSLLCRWDYTNDKKGNCFEARGYGTNGYYESIFYKYDKRGNITETKIVQTDSFKKTRYQYKYDWEIERCKYDDKNNKVAEVHLRSDNSLVNESHYKFNENDLMEELDYREPDSTKNNHCRFIYKLDDQGNWIRQDFYAGGSIIRVRNRNITYFQKEN